MDKAAALIGTGAGASEAIIVGAVREFATTLARFVADELRATDTTIVTQHESPLGPRGHRAAVKRRVAEGTGDAWIRKRKYLMTRAALLEELSRPAESPDRPGLAKTKAARTVREEQLRAELLAGLKSVRRRR